MDLISQYARRGDIINTLSNITKELNNIVMRIDYYFELLKKLAKNRQWRTETLEKIGKLILKYAKEIALTGYTGHEALERAWEERDAITKRLYFLAGYTSNKENTDSELPGLSTKSGGGDLIKSLELDDSDNIFFIKPDLGIVTVGSKNRFAKVLEEGGVKRGGHLGFDENFAPTKWLIKALQEKEDLSLSDAISEAKKILKSLQSIANSESIPPRPFLKPALYFLQDKEEDVKIVGNLFKDYLNSAFKNIPARFVNFDSIEATFEGI
jgi:hypothetical protein